MTKQLLTAKEMATKALNARSFDHLEKILQEWLDSYVDRWKEEEKLWRKIEDLNFMQNQEIGHVYEDGGKFYFRLAHFSEPNNPTRFGPYDDKDKAECDLAEAAAMWE